MWQPGVDFVVELTLPVPPLALTAALLSFWFDTESHCVVQAGLELSVLPTSVSQSFPSIFT